MLTLARIRSNRLQAEASCGTNSKSYCDEETWRPLMWWILHSVFATHVVRSTILDNGIAALLLDLGALSNRHLDITYRHRCIEVTRAGNSAGWFAYVCERCELFPAEDILWWCSTNHGQRRKKNSMVVRSFRATVRLDEVEQLADERTGVFFCTRSARWRVGHYDQCVETGHEWRKAFLNAVRTDLRALVGAVQGGV